jgi:hypothetical protein
MDQAAFLNGWAVIIKWNTFATIFIIICIDWVVNCPVKVQNVASVAKVSASAEQQVVFGVVLLLF